MLPQPSPPAHVALTRHQRPAPSVSPWTTGQACGHHRVTACRGQWTPRRQVRRPDPDPPRDRTPAPTQPMNRSYHQPPHRGLPGSSFGTSGGMARASHRLACGAQEQQSGHRTKSRVKRRQKPGSRQVPPAHLVNREAGVCDVSRCTKTQGGREGPSLTPGPKASQSHPTRVPPVPPKGTWTHSSLREGPPGVWTLLRSSWGT